MRQACRLRANAFVHSGRVVGANLERVRIHCPLHRAHGALPDVAARARSSDVQAVSAGRPNAAWVQLDVANAFPSVRRRAVLEVVEEFAPALLPMAGTFLRRTSSFLYQGADGRGVELHEVPAGIRYLKCFNSLVLGRLLDLGDARLPPPLEEAVVVVLGTLFRFRLFGERLALVSAARIFLGETFNFPPVVDNMLIK